MTIRDPHRRKPAFTLVEMLIVVVTLAILAGLAIPYFDGETTTARVNTTRNILRTLGTAVDVYRFRFLRGTYPATILSEWFVTRTLPANPMDTSGIAAASFQVVNTAGVANPSNIALDGTAAGYWYNRANGIIRARVPPQSTDALTTRLYNLVNGTTTTPAPPVVVIEAPVGGGGAVGLD